MGDGIGLGLGVSRGLVLAVGGALGEVGELDWPDPLGAETAPCAHATTQSRLAARTTADLADPNTPILKLRVVVPTPLLMVEAASTSRRR